MGINRPSTFFFLELYDGFLCVRWLRHQGLYSLSGKTSSGKISKVSRDSGLHFSNRSDISHASVCQVSVRYGNYNIKSSGFETSRNLVERRLTAEWMKAQYEFCQEISCVCLSAKIRYHDNLFLKAFQTQWKTGRRQAVSLTPKTYNTAGCR